jgi:hypothetical protein
MSSPYRPPEAKVADPEPRRGAPVKGMVYGVLVDVGGSVLASFLLFFVWAVWLAASGLDAEQITKEVQEPDPLSGISLLAYTIGGALSWLGGYVCARVARETELRCAAVVATVSGLVALVMGGAMPSALHIFLTLLTVAAVMLGGWMGMQQNARQP